MRLHARNVVLGMTIALKSGFAVTGVACGSTKSVLVAIKRRVPKVFYCERCAM